jgi:threonylcarbamoyladenosine tRNA methylthiotransferase MtaB
MPGPVKKARARRMRELGARKKHDFCAGFIDARVSVLIEEKIDKFSGLRRGFSRNYLPIVVAGADDLLNREIDVRIDGWQNGWLSGRRADEPDVTARADTASLHPQ